MFKKTIKYTDFNGTSREEDYYFHMSVPEVARMEAKLGGMSLPDYARQLQADQDADLIIQFMENIILTAYGKKSSDGKNFLKGPKIREEFEYSQAYAELFEELILSEEKAGAFAEGVAMQTRKMKATGEDYLQPVE